MTTPQPGDRVRLENGEWATVQTYPYYRRGKGRFVECAYWRDRKQIICEVSVSILNLNPTKGIF